MKELEARKRALVTESEVYRETLKLELLNLQIYGARVQRKLATYAAFKPLLFVGVPLIVSLLGRRRHGRHGLFAAALVGYRVYRGFAPLLHQLIAWFGGSGPKHLPQQAETAPTAKI